MRIKITVGFLALACLLGWLDLKFCGCFLLGVLVHEAGHFMVLRLCGIPVTGISLGLCGAVMDTGCMSYRQEFLCAAAGPAASVLLGLPVLPFASMLGLISLGLAAVNLLPLYPLDGGRMLHAFLMLLLPQKRAERVLHTITVAVCLLLMVAACWVTVCLQAGIWPIFAALVLLWRIGGMEKQLHFSCSADKMKGQEH